MPGETLIFPAGSAIAFTSGEYSDYDMAYRSFVTLKECNLPALAQEYNANYVRNNEWDYPSSSRFSAWLITQGYALPADIQVVHLGSYGSWEPEFGVKENEE